MWVKVYGRRSRHLGDPNDLDVLAHQIQPLIAFARREGIPVTPLDVVEEIGSAETIAARPRFKAILAELAGLPERAGGVILVSETSRLSRGNKAEWAKIEAALLRADVKIQTLSRRYDLADADDELFLSFISSLDRHEHLRAKVRSRYSLEERTRQGKVVTGKKTLGYDWDKQDRRLKVRPEELSVVRQLFAAAPTTSTYALADRFGLTQTRVKNVLTNPVYTGWPARHTENHLQPDGERRVARRLARADYIWPEAPGDYEPAVSREQWETVQAALVGRFSRRDKPSVANGWCRGLVTFAGLEGTVVLGSRRLAGERVPVYSLLASSERGARLLSYVERETVHTSVTTWLERHLAEPELLARALTAWQQETARRSQGFDEARVETIRLELARCRKQYTRLKIDLADADDPEERAALVAAEREVKERLDSLKSELQEQERRVAPQERSSLAEWLESRPASVAGTRTWQELPNEERRALAEAMISGVVIAVEPRPHPERWRRTVATIEPAPWLALTMLK